MSEINKSQDVCLELSLNMVYNFLVHLEGFAKDIICDGWLGAKHCIGYGDHSGVLAAQRRNGYCFVGSTVELKVNQPFRKNKHVSFVKNFGK